MVQQDLKEQQGHKELQEIKALRVQQAHKVTQDLKEQQDHKEHKDLQAHREDKEI